MGIRRIGRVAALAAAICAQAACSGGQLTGGTGAGDGGVGIGCTGIPAPSTRFECRPGVLLQGTYVSDRGACVLVYDCPPPGVPVSTIDSGLDANWPIDASPPGQDATEVGPTYPCGDAGLTCSCPAAFFPPAPFNDAGQQVEFALSPPPGQVTPYSTEAQFAALAVGRWRRVAGEAEVECETVGLEITADFELIPLVTASDGSLQPVQDLAQPLRIEFDGAMPSIPGNNVPVFYDDGAGPGTGMQLLTVPWLADYDKML